MEEKIKCRYCDQLIPYSSKVCEACGGKDPLPKADKIKDRIILGTAGIVGVLTVVLILGTIFSYIRLLK
ncbi:hypothetical protein P9126_04175 [Bacillus glycinifermentans]|uniref:hypothetical protein n=1 Tax=Bacillus glycinifermentans TaxID=1664069 RepID=UPI002DC0637F|nr:hypothetical protein [Bacillus glycinifermentans]MEC3606214.1 hypothetical protein [Bacillus glycinifermentans]